MICKGCSVAPAVVVARIKFVGRVAPLLDDSEIGLCGECMKREATGPTFDFFTVTFLYGEPAADRLAELDAARLAQGARPS